MFDLKKYNASHETNSSIPPIRNKWFKFYKLDMSLVERTRPKIPDDFKIGKYIENWGGALRGHAWKKTSKYDPVRREKLKKQIEDWKNTVHKDENLIPIRGFWRCYGNLWKKPFMDQNMGGGNLEIILPQLYIGHSEPIRTLEKMGWWLFHTIFFRWIGLFIWSLLAFLFTITLINIPLVLLGIIK